MIDANGFALILKYQLYPGSHRALAQRVREELGDPLPWRVMDAVWDTRGGPSTDAVGNRQNAGTWVLSKTFWASSTRTLVRGRQFEPILPVVPWRGLLTRPNLERSDSPFSSEPQRPHETRARAQRPPRRRTQERTETLFGYPGKASANLEIGATRI